MNSEALSTLIDQYNSTSAEIIHANIKNLMKFDTAQSLAEKTGNSIHAVYAWTKNKSMKPTFENAVKICKAAGINVEDLISE
jgi:DNA-binding phage protein